MDFVFAWGSINTRLQLFESKLVFVSGHRNSLVFRVAIELT